ncbi:tRNA-binding protein [Sanyastnella coralliicola]|uniref:tRNA-binding protein n=1 Tax=Sanyastnella coralliicola TaxID=3069118 RepID=UPI0027B9304A|nr:tRNA-binding protein [Longitalea sp. SCSIO 12813]
MEKTSTNLSFDDFLKVDIRVGTVTDAKAFEKARNPAYQLWIDFGPELGTKKTSAQITDLYSIDELPGKQVLAVVNFPPKQIANFMSECLVLGAVDKKGAVTLLGLHGEAENGLRVS